MSPQRTGVCTVVNPTGIIKCEHREDGTGQAMCVNPQWLPWHPWHKVQVAAFLLDMTPAALPSHPWPMRACRGHYWKQKELSKGLRLFYCVSFRTQACIAFERGRREPQN